MRATGKVSHLAGIDYRHCEPGSRQRTGDRHLQAAGRLKNDKVSRFELPAQRADSNLIVSHRKGLSARPDEHFHTFIQLGTRMLAV
jgi:hypothetical protein